MYIASYIVPENVINGIYSLEYTLCWLIISLILIIALFEVKGLVKIIVSIISLLILLLHYSIVINLTRYEEITLLPLFLIESTRNGSVVMIDYGQLVIIGLLYIWRKKLIMLIKRLREEIHNILQR